LYHTRAKRVKSKRQLAISDRLSAIGVQHSAVSVQQTAPNYREAWIEKIGDAIIFDTAVVVTPVSLAIIAMEIPYLSISSLAILFRT